VSLKPFSVKSFSVSNTSRSLSGFSLREKLAGTPWLLLLTVYIIWALGAINMYSATSAGVTPERFIDQIKWSLLGTASLIFWGFILDLKSIEKLSVFAYVVICFLLLAVDLKGDISKGAQRWLAIGPIRLQPSEFAKFVTILMVAKSFEFTKGISQFNLRSLWRQMLFIGIPFLLILAQPDLGTAGLVLLISCTQLAFVKIDFKSILLVSLASLSISVLAWNFILYDYQKLRVLNFINPMRDPKGAGYHSIQSMIAVGNGGVWGKGFQQGSQSQLNFLPERHTDFAFSVIAEDFGFVGCLILFAAFAALVFQIFQIIDMARDSFAALVAAGVLGFFIFHFAINVAMVLGVFPVVGVPLSLVSYGGTHMLTVLSCVGLLVAVERKRREN
jgi:rod shape determining protein RodA